MKLLSLILLCLPLAAADCRQLEKLSRLDEARACFAAQAESTNLAERAEGLWGLGEFKEANDAFRQAVQAQEKNAGLRVRWGRLLLERFNVSESQQLFQEALKTQPDSAPAMFGLALSLSESFDRKAVDLARKAVESDPNLLEAQELVAALVLEDGDFKKADEEANKALKISPQALDAIAVLAAIDLLSDKGPSAWTSKMLAASPRYGRGYAKIARWFVLNRRYEEAIALYRKALDLRPDLWAARSELGINLMRVGQDQEARQQLEQCYENGYRDKPTVNSLTLLDSFKNFETIRTPRAVLRLHKKEAALLRPYLEREVERAIGTFEKKYERTLPGPVQIELYPDHQDFAVRTMGMPGLGALGVTFVLSIAMDSPSGRPPGSYHWASTLWHEMSHVFTLNATNHRVPRWFTEGLAVHEETAVNKEWGERVTPDALTAIKGRKLLPIAELDRGFVRPTHPEQIIVSYFQAGRVCDYIEQRWGWSKLMAMLGEFSKVDTTAAVVERTLGMKPEQFDIEFLAWLEKEHAATLAGFVEFRKSLKAFNQSVKAKEWDGVLEQGNKLKPLFREYVQGGSVYEGLAEAHQAKGEKEAASRELFEYVRQGGREPDTLKRLAAIESELGRQKSAEAVLERILWIYPVADPELHERLGELRANAGEWQGAAEEFRAVVELKPADPAAAHYNLARAFNAMRRWDEAEEHVLTALEQAPGYRPAQKLLLELNENRSRKK